MDLGSNPTRRSFGRGLIFRFSPVRCAYSRGERIIVSDGPVANGGCDRGNGYRCDGIRNHSGGMAMVTDV